MSPLFLESSPLRKYVLLERVEGEGETLSIAHTIVPIPQGEHRADTAVGGYAMQARLLRSSRQVLDGTLPIGQVSAHTSQHRKMQFQVP